MVYFHGINIVNMKKCKIGYHIYALPQYSPYMYNEQAISVKKNFWNLKKKIWK